MNNFDNNLDIIDPDNNHFEPNINFQCHTLNTFPMKQDIDPNSLVLIHHNARSLMAATRIDEYELLFQTLKHTFDILVFTETWLTPDKEDQCKFPGYNHIHLLRPISDDIDFKARGGGVSIFIKNNLEYTHRPDLTTMLPYMECSFIEMKYNNIKYLIGGIYRVPNTNIDSFLTNFNSIIEPLKSTHKIILLGDYNIDLLKNDKYKNDFELCLQSNYLMPTILSSTRVATKIINNQEVTSETLIDNIMINYNMEYQSGIIETSITDHYSIYIIIPEIKKVINGPYTIQYRLYNDYCQRKFNFYLQHYGIKDVMDMYNAESAFDQFDQIFEDTYNKSFPIKTKTITAKRMQKPWVTEALIDKVDERERLHTLQKKKIISRAVFTDYKNKLTNEFRKAKSKYYKDQFEKNSNNVKKTWEVINSVIRSKKTHSKISLTDDDNNDIIDSEIPNKYIDYYTSIANKLTSNIPPTQRDAASYLQDRIPQNFTMTPICPNEVSTVIDDLKNNGHKVNTISTAVLVESKHIIVPIICHLINLFVQQGYFPKKLKTGCITPIYKNGDRKKVNNYRPVCSLSPLSKIIEKVINNRMVDFLDDNDIFSMTQFGFRKNMGTESALLNYVDHLQSKLNSSEHGISIFLDLSKAFDVIDHKILKTKLHHYGFRGKFLEFILSFIRDRQYFVHVNGKDSDTKTVNIGVPQGSTLGPLLFLLYINDMAKISILLFLSQFADDSTITYFSKISVEHAKEVIEKELKIVLEWLAANKLIINLGKTQLMVFSNSPRRDPVSITVNNQIINEITETKFLGVILDNKLCWNAHIKHISNKMSKSVSILKILKHTFPTNALKTIYHSLIYPYFNYCNLIWGSAASTHLQSLTLIQKKCIRIISKAGYYDHTEPLFKEHKILTVTEIYEYNCTKFIYQCYNNKTYTNFKNKLVKNSDVHSHNTRNKGIIRKPRVRLHKFINSFLYKGIDMWNELPDRIKLINSFDSFKIAAKAFVIGPN